MQHCLTDKLFNSKTAPVKQAFKELSLWESFLQNFPRGESKFVQWSFWPGTVFSAQAASDLVTLFAKNNQLQTIMQRSKNWAAEEVILSALTALLGDLVQFRKYYTQEQLMCAIRSHQANWVHPVPRDMNFLI